MEMKIKMEKPFQSSGSEYVAEDISFEHFDTEPIQEPICILKKYTDYFIVERDPKSTRKNDKFGRCTLCTTTPTILKMKNCATSSLKRHLQTKHTKVYESFFRTAEKSTSEHSDSEPIQEPTPKRSKNDEKKKYTDYFIVERDPKSTRKNDKFGRCTLCTTKPTILKMKNCATSSLKRHLQTQHTKVYENFFGIADESISSASSITSKHSISQWLNDSTTKEKHDTSGFLQDKFQTLLVEYVVKKYLPLNFFEDEITEKLYKFLNPNATLPGSNEMHSIITKTFEAAQNALRCFLKRCSTKISFTIDGWSCFNMKGYYGITCHFIDNNWKLHSLLLDFVPAHEECIGSSVAKLFFDVLRFYDLTNSVQAITTDNTNSDFTFIKELKRHIFDINSDNNHFVCFAHILSLAAKDFMKILGSELEDTDNLLSNVVIEEINSPLEKIHCLAKKLNNSEHLRKDFEKCCNNVNLKMTLPQLDVITRWYAIFEMLRWSLNVKTALNILCDNTESESMKFLKLTDTEWSLLERVCQYLKSFKTISTTLEGEANCTLSMVIIGINMLLDKLEKWAHELDTNLDGDDIDEQLINSIQTARYKIMKHYKRSNWIYCVVLILDPRHKVETFSNTVWGKELQMFAVKYFEEIFKINYFQSNPQLASCSKSKETNDCSSEFDIDLLGLFKKSSVETKDKTTWRYEIDKYLSDPRADSSEDVLDWWKRHENVFPNLAAMAKDFLAIQATSATVERQFSRAALNATRIQIRLGDKSIRNLMCLNSWMANDDIKGYF